MMTHRLQQPGRARAPRGASKSRYAPSGLPRGAARSSMRYTAWSFPFELRWDVEAHGPEARSAHKQASSPPLRQGSHSCHPLLGRGFRLNCAGM
jgi:hypothetical protein